MAEGCARRDGYSLADFQRLAGTLPEGYYAGLATAVCFGCGAALPTGRALYCDPACARRDRARNQRRFGREAIPSERLAGLETLAICSEMPGRVKRKAGA